ncbi:MAG: COG4315 family predicted lipoprotein [Acidimicrobiales bacterium]
MRVTARAVRGAAVSAVVLGLGAAACGTSSPTKPASSTTSTTTPANASAAGLVAESSAYGSILATSSGKTLYEHSNDTSNNAGCTGACAKVWPAYTVSAAPSIGTGVKLTLLGEVGKTAQLSYGTRPLYTFAGDTAAHGTKGEGIKSFGGTWYVLSASTGKPVTAKVPGTSSGTLPGGV